MVVREANVVRRCFECNFLVFLVYEVCVPGNKNLFLYTYYCGSWDTEISLSNSVENRFFFLKAKFIAPQVSGHDMYSIYKNIVIVLELAVLRCVCKKYIAK